MPLACRRTHRGKALYAQRDIPQRSPGLEPGAGSLTHLEASDLHWYDSAYFVLCCCVVLLTELHDVQTLHASIALPEAGTLSKVENHCYTLELEIMLAE